MAEKMDDEDVINILKRNENAASHYVHGQLGTERELAMREYHRLPYGNEVEGESQVVASDIQDSVEWILPALLKTFTATDKAVSFEPNTAKDVDGAEQATDTCNYVFYKQNNGFLVLYTAIKDMLTVKNCAVMWRKENIETVSSVPFKGASTEMLAMMLQEEDAEIEQANPAPMLDEQGQPHLDPMTGETMMVYNGRIKKTETKSIVKVEAFSPDLLLVMRDWTSPLLQDCPYVCRLMRVTLSEIKMMGFKDVTPQDLRASDNIDYNGSSYQSRINNVDNSAPIENHFNDDDGNDDAMAEGWLRIEYALIDKDGDGIAERLCIYRLQDKILKCEVTSHVPIATSSPTLNTHRWDGLSIADAVTDLQKLHTELLRQTLNNLYLTNNPRTKVLTDANWSPLANIDDLLDSRAGGIIRQRDVNAISEQIIPFSAGASMPMLEYVQSMRENRTGVSRQSQGLNPDSLNNTATGRQIDMSASMQRIELIARIIAETLIKPIFQGILKTLTDGGMQKLAFRLRDQFVEYDPNEWRDQYDMTINVGLGTGDTQAKAQQLMAIMQLQKEGLAVGLTTPKHLYHSASKIIENAGFKDVQNFVQDPSLAPPKPPEMPLPLQIEQMKIQANAQKHQAEMQADIQKFQAETQMTRETEQIKADAKLREIQGNLELQAANDQRDSEREVHKAQMDAQLEQQRIEFERWKAELTAQTQIYLEQLKIGNAQPIDTGGDINNSLAVAIEGIRATMDSMNRPKTIIRGPDGRAAGIA
ncbi:MAG: hypothetical protein HQ446_05850 [Polaromonas sp.]|nr:hypothetical protein [Polaromonas sp.]